MAIVYCHGLFGRLNDFFHVFGAGIYFIAKAGLRLGWFACAHARHGVYLADNCGLLVCDALVISLISVVVMQIKKEDRMVLF